MPRSCQVTSAGPLMSGGRQNTSWPRHAAGSHSEDQAAGRDQSDTQVIALATTGGKGGLGLTAWQRAKSTVLGSQNRTQWGGSEINACRVDEQPPNGVEFGVSGPLGQFGLVRSLLFGG